MAKTVAETIKEISRKHLEESDGLLFGQAITAVGWVNNTVPDCKNIVEFPMADVSNMGIACGAAISGRRPIIVIRFQDFMWLNSSPLINYAAKSKDIFQTATPIFVRAIASENAGCVHSAVLHSIFMHMPGLSVYSPMTPSEYEETWRDFMENDDPMFVSEHRTSFQNTKEFADIIHDHAEVTLVPISAARFNVNDAVQELEAEGIKCNVAHVFRLKPLDCEQAIKALHKSNIGLVIDPGFETAGASQSIAYNLMIKTGKPVMALGLEDRSAGVSANSINMTPSARKISAAVKDFLGGRNALQR